MSKLKTSESEGQQLCSEVQVTIDGITIKVPKGSTILQAARKIGGQVVPPAMCYYSKLEQSGGRCRTCLVEVSRCSTNNSNAMPKLVASCRMEVVDGMEVKNMTSEKVAEARRGVTEFLLINHPLDCPTCDQAGECHLQDLSFSSGLSNNSRFEFKKRTFEQEDIGEYIQLHMNRCILCYRCVLVANQLTDARVHGLIDRGVHAKISTLIGKSIDNDFSGNIIDVCPVGALTDKTFRFKNRVWFLKPYYAHRNCDKCCGKATIWFRGEDIFRVTARKDIYGEVDEWICNDCRFHNKNTANWTIEGPAMMDRHSVLNQNQYDANVKSGTDPLPALLPESVSPKITFNIHDISEVNTQNQ